MIELVHQTKKSFSRLAAVMIRIRNGSFPIRLMTQSQIIESNRILPIHTERIHSKLEYKNTSLCLLSPYFKKVIVTADFVTTVTSSGEWTESIRLGSLKRLTSVQKWAHKTSKRVKFHKSVCSSRKFIALLLICSYTSMGFGKFSCFLSGNVKNFTLVRPENLCLVSLKWLTNLKCLYSIGRLNVFLL